MKMCIQQPIFSRDGYGQFELLHQHDTWESVPTAESMRLKVFLAVSVFFSVV